MAEREFDYPSARIAAGQVIKHVATSAIDISDGLVQDLEHILKSSQVSAEINLNKLPISQAVLNSVEQEKAIEMALYGGEDYEILFTLPEEHKAYLEQNITSMGVECHCIGQIKNNESGLVLFKDGEKYPMSQQKGFEHFSAE